MNKRQYKKYLKKLKCRSYSKMREKMRETIAYYKKLGEFNPYECELGLILIRPPKFISEYELDYDNKYKLNMSRRNKKNN